MAISEEKIQALELKLKELNIKEEDLIEKFIKGSGKGGQKVNKTASCVHLKHIPSGIEVKCQKTRSREENRFFARRLLSDKYQEQILNKKTPASLKAEKAKKQKLRRRSKSAKKYDNS